MAVSFVASSTATQAYTGNPLAITKPSGTQDDDLLIAIIGGTRSGSTPSGWTQLGTTTCGSSTGTVYVYYKTASSEASSYSFPTGTQLALGVVLCYRGTGGIDATDFSLGTDSGTDYTTGAATADGTQWAVSFAMAYKGSTGNSTISASGSTTRQASFGVTSGSENTSMAVFDSNGRVASGSTTRAQTVSPSSAAGAKGLLLINDPGVNVSAIGATGVTTTAYRPTIDIQTVQLAPTSADAFDASVKVEPNADVADDTVVAGYSALRPAIPGVATATAGALGASSHLDANAHDADVVTDANAVSAYYGAAVVRVYVVPGENRTYKVQR
jgi:hypothetical protein